MIQNYSTLELTNIFNQLISKNLHTQETASKQLAFFIHRNREYSEEIISKISRFFSTKENELSDRVMIRSINNVINILRANNTQILNFLNMILPLLFHIIFHAQRQIHEFDLIIKTIGNLIVIGGNHTSQIIESYISSLFDKFSIQEPTFKFENTKYALISLLKEYTKHCPAIVYNKIIESFDAFSRIVDNFKDPKPAIREATHKLCEEFLQLLSQRDCNYKQIKYKFKFIISIYH